MPQKPSKPQTKTIDKTHEKALKTVAKGAGIAVVGMILGKLFSYLTRVFIARSFGPETYGLIAMGLATISIITTFSLIGLDLGLTRFIAFYRGKRNLGKVKGSIKSSFKITLPLSIIFAAALFIFSEQVAIFFSKQDLVPVIKILSFALPFSVILGLFQSTLLGFKLVKQKVYTVEIGKNLSTLIFVIIFFYLGFGLFGATIGFVLGFFLSVIVGVYHLKGKILPQLKKIKPIRVSKELVSFSLPLLMVATLSLLMAWTDVLMLGYFDTVANVGIYSAVLNTGILLSFVFQGFSFIFTPLISEFYSRDQIKEIRKIYKSSTRWTFSITFPLFLLFILFPDNILKILFNEEFVSGSTSLIILSFGIMFSVFIGLARETITSIGKTKIIFYFTLIAASSNFIINLILIPIYGMVGAAIAMLVSLILWSLLPLLYIHKKMGVWPYDRNYLKPFFVSLSSVGTIYFLLKFIFKSTDTLILIVGFIIFILLYGVLFLLTKGLTKEDILILKSIEKKTGLNIGWLRNIIKKTI